MSPPANDTLQKVQLMRIFAGVRLQGEDIVLRETPIALLYNGEPFAVMMATPTDLYDFALGFSISEGIVQRATELQIVDLIRNEHGVAMHCAIPQKNFDALGERRRNLEGRSGCGLCGTESLQAALRPLPVLPIGTTTLDASRIALAFAHLAQQQPLNAVSGGAHAAAIVGFDATHPMIVREDVGRHNALDKAIGAALGETYLLNHCFALVTSRASYELVQKTASAGVTVLAAISAPTDLAIGLAHEVGLTLIAFARGESMNIYSHSKRIV